MTIKEAIKILRKTWFDYHHYLPEQDARAVDMAIKALDEVMDRASIAKKCYKLTLEEWFEECDGQKIWEEQPWTIECVSLDIAGEDKEMLLSMMCKKLMEFAVPTLVLCEKRGIYGRDKGLYCGAKMDGKENEE